MCGGHEINACRCTIDRGRPGSIDVGGRRGSRPPSRRVKGKGRRKRSLKRAGLCPASSPCVTVCLNLSGDKVHSTHRISPSMLSSLGESFDFAHHVCIYVSNHAYQSVSQACVSSPTPERFRPPPFPRPCSLDRVRDPIAPRPALNFLEPISTLSYIFICNQSSRRVATTPPLAQQLLN